MSVRFLPLHIFSFFIHIQVKLQKAAHLIIYNCCQSFFYEAAEWCRDVMYSRGEAITPGVPFDLLAFVRLLHSWETCNERKWHAVIRFVYDTRRTYISRKLPLTHTHTHAHTCTLYIILCYICVGSWLPSRRAGLVWSRCLSPQHVFNPSVWPSCPLYLPDWFVRLRGHDGGCEFVRVLVCVCVCVPLLTNMRTIYRNTPSTHTHTHTQGLWCEMRGSRDASRSGAQRERERERAREK